MTSSHGSCLLALLIWCKCELKTSQRIDNIENVDVLQIDGQWRSFAANDKHLRRKAKNDSRVVVTDRKNNKKDPSPVGTVLTVTATWTNQLCLEAFTTPWGTFILLANTPWVPFSDNLKNLSVTKTRDPRRKPFCRFRPEKAIQLSKSEDLFDPLRPVRLNKAVCREQSQRKVVVPSMETIYGQSRGSQWERKSAPLSFSLGRKPSNDKLVVNGEATAHIFPVESSPWLSRRFVYDEIQQTPFTTSSTRLGWDSERIDGLTGGLFFGGASVYSVSREQERALWDRLVDMMWRVRMVPLVCDRSWWWESRCVRSTVLDDSKPSSKFLRQQVSETKHAYSVTSFSGKNGDYCSRRRFPNRSMANYLFPITCGGGEQALQ